MYYEFTLRNNFKFHNIYNVTVEITSVFLEAKTDFEYFTVGRNVV